ncbi:hypothetical protein DPEC_G00231860 [Dallia pectoralis]|uniref:Uncharacterized protein n=1 Tax=Dallia pectoralis TaxID=75939 RepID=A0ACC2FX77_DALPE|nr:hypothetical protein DPEC_G00231860 [Dallia pectoralis]
MATGSKGRDATRSRRQCKNQLDWTTRWSNCLKEMAGLLPISESGHGRPLTKKETLVQMLHYFDFLQIKIQTLQRRLPPDSIPKQKPDTGSESEENPPSGSCTPSRILKTKHQVVCTRSHVRTSSEVKAERQLRRKRLTAEVSGKKAGPNGQDVPVPMWGFDWSEGHSGDSYGRVYEGDSQPSSQDSSFSLSQLLPLSSPLAGCPGTSSASQGGQCSVCEDGRESSPKNGVSDTPTTPITGPRSPFLKDHLCGVIPSMGGQWQPFLSPAATPKRPNVTLGESLNLSPSLFTSPGRGLSQCLLPEGPDELQVLFNDVWVTPKTTHPKGSRLSNRNPTDWLSDGKAVLRHSSTWWPSSQSDGEEGDVTWTPKELQVRLKPKTSGTRRRHRASTRGRPLVPSNLKKKCVNGFIMFCRINRKTYLCTHPGTPSTVVTKELASLWNSMPKQERRVYCLKARRFSRQLNRNVKTEPAEGEEEDPVPSPLHMLLAQRELRAASRRDS